LVVGTSMHDALGHGRQKVAVSRALTDYARNPAHDHAPRMVL